MTGVCSPVTADVLVRRVDTDAADIVGGRYALP